jgi:hypothetical protein
MDRERKNRLPSDSRARWGLLGLLALAGWGCTTVQQGGTQRTALIEATGAKSSAADLRAMDNALAISVPGIIESATDHIRARSPDAAMKRRALLWKIEVIPAFYQALFQADPLAAALEAWSLSIQLEEILSAGAGSDQLGPLQPAATEAVHGIRMQIEAAARATAKTPEGFERAKASVESWAREHPMVGSISSRPSILPELTRMAAGGLDISVFQAVADIPATVADLATRMDIYAAYLPKAARWQAELMADDFADRGGVQRVLATLASVERLTERTNELLSPAGLRGALDTASGQIRAERIAAFASIDRQRVETLAYLTRERVAAVADIDRERDVLVRQLDDLRRNALSDVDELAGRVIRNGALAVALLLVLAAGLALLVLRLAFRMRVRSSETP